MRRRSAGRLPAVASSDCEIIANHLSTHTSPDRIRVMAKTIEDATSVHRFDDADAGTPPASARDTMPNTPVDTGNGVNVRHYRFADGGRIGRLPHRVELNLPESCTLQPNTVRLLTQRFLNGDEGSWPMLVAEHDGDVQGALYSQVHQQDGRWHLQYALSEQLIAETDSVGIALVEYAIKQAGCRGARRVMARVDHDHPMRSVLQRCAFSSYGDEMVFSLPAVPHTTASSAVRSQEASDVWAIHQLYLHTTPREVQNAEALTSHEWEIDTEGRSKRGWFIVDAGLMLAYARVRTNRTRHALDVMYLPEAASRLDELIQTVCATLAQSQKRRIYASARSYQQEAATAMENLGLEFITQQSMMVRYTTVPAASHMRPVDAFERLRTAETEAQRVPSYYMRDVHE